MNNWIEVSKSEPCEVCGKPNWCSLNTQNGTKVCRRVSGGKEITDKSGGIFWLYTNSERSVHEYRYSKPSAVNKRIERGDNKTLDLVYSKMLEVLKLENKHLIGLLRQRKIPMNEIKDRGYKTLNKEIRNSLCSQMLDFFSRETLETVPGFFLDTNGDLKVLGYQGLVIPVKSALGEILALKIRTDGKGRYIYFSSKSKGGPSSGSHVHFPDNDYLKGNILRVTEGELKADIATIYSGVATISIPGVNSWKKVIPIIKYLKPKLIKIAFDNDYIEKEQVARSIVSFSQFLEFENINYEIEVWK